MSEEPIVLEKKVELGSLPSPEDTPEWESVTGVVRALQIMMNGDAAPRDFLKRLSVTVVISFESLKHVAGIQRYSARTKKRFESAQTRYRDHVQQAYPGLWVRRYTLDDGELRGRSDKIDMAVTVGLWPENL